MLSEPSAPTPQVKETAMAAEEDRVEENCQQDEALRQQEGVVTRRPEPRDEEDHDGQDLCFHKLSSSPDELLSSHRHPY